MLTTVPGLMDAVRARFAHVDACPFSGPRVFFENAGGALTLKSVVETSGIYAAIPDNQGRDNPASKALMAAIDRAKAPNKAQRGQVCEKTVITLGSPKQPPNQDRCPAH
jgi:hypothetical protein